MNMLGWPLSPPFTVLFSRFFVFHWGRWIRGAPKLGFFFCFVSSSGFASLVRSFHDHAATRRGFDLLWVISIPFPSALKWISEGIFICLSRSLCAAWILARWCKHRRPNISLCTTQGLCLNSWYYISERRSFWPILCWRLFQPMLLNLFLWPHISFCFPESSGEEKTFSSLLRFAFVNIYRKYIVYRKRIKQRLLCVFMIFWLTLRLLPFTAFRC